MPNREGMKRVLRELFAAQKLAVLATRAEHGHPYASLMAFAASEDLDRLLLATQLFAQVRQSERRTMGGAADRQPIQSGLGLARGRCCHRDGQG